MSSTGWKRISISTWRKGEYTVTRQSAGNAPGKVYGIVFECRKGDLVIGRRFGLKEAQQLAA